MILVDFGKNFSWFLLILDDLILIRIQPLIITKLNCQDKFPKAEHHYLVLPVERIQNLAALSNQHVNLIKVNYNIHGTISHLHQI